VQCERDKAAAQLRPLQHWQPNPPALDPRAPRRVPRRLRLPREADRRLESPFALAIRALIPTRRLEKAEHLVSSSEAPASVMLEAVERREIGEILLVTETPTQSVCVPQLKVELLGETVRGGLGDRGGLGGRGGLGSR